MRFNGPLEFILISFDCIGVKPTTRWLSVGEFHSFLTAPNTGCEVWMRVRAELEATLVLPPPSLPISRSTSPSLRTGERLRAAGGETRAPPTCPADCEGCPVSPKPRQSAGLRPSLVTNGSQTSLEQPVCVTPLWGCSDHSAPSSIAPPSLPSLSPSLSPWYATWIVYGNLRHKLRGNLVRIKRNSRRFASFCLLSTRMSGRVTEVKVCSATIHLIKAYVGPCSAGILLQAVAQG